jgi:chemotaxis protein CheC
MEQKVNVKENVIEFNEVELDALKEMGNIGCGNAATSLSNMLNKKVYLSFPIVKYVKVEDVPKYVKNKDSICVGVFFNITGDLVGNMLLIFTEKSAKDLISVLMGVPVSEIELDDMSLSGLKETGNIIFGNYLNSLADFFEMTLLPSVPHVAIDTPASMMNSIAAYQSQYFNNVLLTDADIFVEGESVFGDFVLMFDNESTKKIIKSIHDKLGV